MLDEAQANAQAERESKGIPQLSPEQEKEIENIVKPLFQKSYKIMYEDGLFDALVQEIEAGTEAAEALPRMLTAMLSAVIRDEGVDSMDVLFNLGILLMSDILHTLQEMGLGEMDETNAQGVISQTVKAVMEENPEFAQKVMQDPRTKGMMQGAGDQLQPAAQGPAAIPQQGPPAEGGVMPPPPMGGM